MKKTLLTLVILCTFQFVFFTGEAYAQTDMTDRIGNNDFEEQQFGAWKTNGFGMQGNNDFPLKHGGKYVEVWSGGTAPDASIKQQIVNLPAGTYTIAVVGQNINQSSPNMKCSGVNVFANDEKVAIQQPDEYTLICVVTDGNLLIGAEVKNCTGNYVCLDNFRLFYDFVMNDILPYLNALIKEAEDIDLGGDSPEHTELVEAREALRSLIAKEQEEGMEAAVNRLKEAMKAYTFSLASPKHPYDITDNIVNNDFESALEGWTVSDMGSQTNNDYPGKHGSTYVERWAGPPVGDCNLKQTITNLPEGQYQLKASAWHINQNDMTTRQRGAYLFGEDQKTEVTSQKDYTVSFISITGDVTIGLTAKNATGNWICVDNFRLYYLGHNEAKEKQYFENVLNNARSLVGKDMNADVAQDLDAAIKAAEQFSGTEGRAAVATRLKQCSEAASESISIYEDLKSAIDDAKKVFEAGGANGKDEFEEVLDQADALYQSKQIDQDKVDAMKDALDNAKFAYLVANGTGEAPQVTTYPTVLAGCNGAVGRLTATGNYIIERGFCWAENPNPTVTDNHTSFNYSNDETNYQPVYIMYGLKASTEYWVRAYAITKEYAVGYGEPVRIITLPQGETEYTFLWNGDDEHNAWLDNAMKEATAYYNTWTAIKGFHPTANYSPGTETADCSYGGWINVGPWRCNTGTMVHEMMHGTGVGQHGRWWDSNLKDGIWWQGERANRVCHFFELDPSRGNYNCNGDNIHVCFQGNGNDMQQIRSSILMQALYEDGLPAVSDGACPFYSYESIDSLKYYISNYEYGNAEKFLSESSTGKVQYVSVESLDELADDSFAWYLLYDKMTGFYNIKNVKTGKVMSFNGSSVTLKQTETISSYENIQLMPARINAEYTVGAETFTLKPYWFAQGSRACDPKVFNMEGSRSKTVTSAQLNFTNKATDQFWVIFSQADVKNMITAKRAIDEDRLNRLIAGSKAISADENAVVEGATKSQFTSNYETIEQEKSTYTTNQEIDAAVMALYENITEYLPQLTLTDTSKPIDISFLLDDPDLDAGKGWSGIPEVKDSMLNLTAKTFEFSQQIPVRMPKGTYGLVVRGFERPGDLTSVMKDYSKGINNVTATITLNNKTQPLKHIGDGGQSEKVDEGGIERKSQGVYVPYNIAAAEAYMKRGVYDNIIPLLLRINTTITVGVKNETTVDQDWIVIDGFRLLYFGEGTDTEVVTDIDEDLTPTLSEGEGEMFNISGQKVSEDYRGIVIINGKKVLKK